MNIKDYNGEKFKPIFYSEISSSYLIFEIFHNHEKIAKSFLNSFLKIDVENYQFLVKREYAYKGKGTIDIFIRLKNPNNEINILIEVKVHDYLSATKGQILTYYEAAKNEQDNAEIYFIYLTQFNMTKFEKFNNTIQPPTIEEFENSKRKIKINKNKIIHINWEELHQFLEKFIDNLSSEEKLMLELQKSWIIQQSKKDIKNNEIVVGTRDLQNYLDIPIDIVKELPFGEKKYKNNQLKYVINLSQCNIEHFNDIFILFEKFEKSNAINVLKINTTEDSTLDAIKEFYSILGQDENNWVLLQFYIRLFDYVHKSECLFLNGTGNRGFSIKTSITNKGEISLCTLWKNRTIEFGLTR